MVANYQRGLKQKVCLLSNCEFCDVKDCKVRFTKYDASVSALCNAFMAILQSS